MPNVVITGAASGLGRALALRYAALGWQVGVTDRDVPGAQAVLEEVRAAGSDGFVQALDVTRSDDFEALAETVRKTWSGLDAMVNNAGVASGGTVEATSDEDWHWVLEIDLLGVVRGCRMAVPLLRQNGGGHIINVASFAGVAAAPGMASYNVAKAGVISLSETLRAEVHNDGTSVTVACPAFFRTNLMQSFRSPHADQDKLVDKLISRARLSAEDIAQEIVRAAQAKQFMVIPQKRARRQYLLKRISPELYFRELMKATAGFMGSKSPAKAAPSTPEQA